MRWQSLAVLAGCLILSFGIQGCSQAAKEVERPEKIVSKRVAVYELEVYQELETRWKAYYDAYPSEDAYANWMYAARYAEDPDYNKMLERGYKKYPANPTILYLMGLCRLGDIQDLEGQRMLERAASLDPSFIDPWFGLVDHYMMRGDDRLDVALRELLAGKAIPNEVMDYNYNTLMLLDPNAILITNGDMDTYPPWILIRILKIRPDVTIVNRSLLNTEWYPGLLMRGGLPRFISPDELTTLRQSILAKIKAEKGKIPSAGPFSDTLLVKIIEAAQREKRPVYFAATLYSSPVIDRYTSGGRNFGLVTLVTPTAAAYEDQIRAAFNTWLKDFRTAGLDDWSLRYTGEKLFGRWLVMNYARSLLQLSDTIEKLPADLRLSLFRWYLRHLQKLIPEKSIGECDRMWCNSSDVKEIGDWCRQQGYLK